MRINLKLPFWICFICTLFAPLLFPKLHLIYFAPYLVCSLYRTSKVGALWRSVGCGVLIDLLSSMTLFGLTSLNFCIVCWILYGQTRNFFEDKLSTLPIMTFLFSMLSTTLSAIFTLLFADGFPLSFRWIVTDLIYMPAIDGFYAFFCFSLPFKLTYKLGKIRLKVFR